MTARVAAVSFFTMCDWTRVEVFRKLEGKIRFSGRTQVFSQALSEHGGSSRMERVADSPMTLIIYRRCRASGVQSRSRRNQEMPPWYNNTR